MKFSINDFFIKCDQLRSFLRIWLHLLKKSLMENFIFSAVPIASDKELKKEGRGSYDIVLTLIQGFMW